MRDVDRLLVDLSRAARSDATPNVDVRARVIDSLKAQSSSGITDIAPIAFAGLAVTVAAVFVFTTLPLWRTLAEPWVAYMP